MNKERRKSIEDLIEILEVAQGNLQIISEEEQDYADCMPENLQGSEKHEKAEGMACELECCASELDDIVTRLTEIIIT